MSGSGGAPHTDPSDPPIARYRQATQELSTLHRELAQCLMAEARAKAQAWRESSEDTVTARARVADLNAIDLTTDIMRIKGDIAAWREEKDYLIALMELSGKKEGNYWG